MLNQDDKVQASLKPSYKLPTAATSGNAVAAAEMPYQRTNEPSLVGLRVAPAAGTYQHGAKVPLTATARYDDNSERDVTALTEFVSQDKELVIVDEAGLMRVGKNNGESVVVA